MPRGSSLAGALVGTLAGLPAWRIVAKHLAPSLLPLIRAQATVSFGSALTDLAAVSFIGLGVQPPTPEWGVMISEGRNYITTQWWLTGVPAGAILLLVAAFNLVGDGLRDLLDPRLKR